MTYVKYSLVEILLALYPVLCGYTFYGLPMSLLLLLIIDGLAIIRSGKILKHKFLMYFVLFVLLHELLILFLTGVNTTKINNFVGLIIFTVSIFIIVPSINIDKYKNAFYLLAFIYTVGIIYHSILIYSGHTVSPIKMPFMPDPGAESRLYEVGDRPVSFFWEPGNYASFMLFPLYFSLYSEKKYYSLLIILAIFISSSTNGVIFSLIMLIGYAFTQKLSKAQIAGIIVFGLLSISALFYLNIFQNTKEKLLNTDYEHTIRLYNGPVIVSNMPSKHLILGIPYYSTEDYYNKTNFVKDGLIILKDHDLFVSSFWQLIIKYGIIGLIIYLFFIYKLYRRNIELRPYILIYFVSMFSQSTLLNAGWFTTVTFMLVINKERLQNKWIAELKS